MSLGAGAFERGGLFEWTAVVRDVRIEVLAEVDIEGTTLHLRDIAVFPRGSDRASVGVAAMLRALREELVPAVRRPGSSGSA